MSVVIIGNGIAGVTAARTIRRLDPEIPITIISGESDHHWSRPALMYIYMGHMRFEDTKPYQDHFWRKNRIELVRGWVTGIDTDSKQLEIDGKGSLGYERLILAVGSKANKFGWPGQDLGRVGGMVSLEDLAAIEAASPGLERAAIVGGGLIGIELAEMFHSRGIPVSFLVRENNYWSNVLPAEEAALVSQVVRDEDIDLRLGTELREIVDDGAGQACAVVDSQGEHIPVGFVGLTAGVRPNIDVCAGTRIKTSRGILVDGSLATNVEGVYAVGDCAEIVTAGEAGNIIQAVWYTGRMQGELVGRSALGLDAHYDPGIWFNSAKFFDLEYQVYGTVPSELSPRQEQSVYWQAEDGRRSCRIVLRGETVIGFNLLGLRFRHRVCERWIQEERSLDEVLKNLREACFDPELYRRWDREIVRGLGRQA
ncbi:MAG: FAD-dependent oxidoreductase [Myxococcota bacterium]|nr:FAD-dependent oxidoreductase [Myxococcota bacterium]